MPLSMPCPSCQQNLTYPETIVGRQARCRSCGTTVTTAAPPVLDATEFAVAPAQDPAAAEAWAAVSRGNWTTLLGLALLFAAVTLTALTQMGILWSYRFPVTAASWGDILISLNDAKYGAWLVYVLGAIGGLVAAATTGLGLMLCWRAPLPNGARHLALGAAACLCLSLLLAVGMPLTLWLFQGPLMQQVMNMSTEDTFNSIALVMKGMLAFAYLTGLTGLILYVLLLRESARCFEDARLAARLTIFGSVAVGGQLAILLVDWFCGFLIRTATINSGSGLLLLTTIFWFLLWWLTVTGLLVWGAVLARQFDAAVKRATRVA